MNSTLPHPRAAHKATEISFCESAKDVCLDLQSQLHGFRHQHELKGETVSAELLADYNATLQHLLAASESLFRLARQESVY